MKLQCRILPAEGVRQDGGIFVATSDLPWLELVFVDGLPQGRWLDLTYRTSWLDTMVRVIVRCEDQTGVLQDDYLPGPLFGSGKGLSFIVPGCKRILVSPVNRKGPFGFEIESCRSITEAELFLRALARDPGRAVSAFGARLIGAKVESRQALCWAIGGVPLRRYNSYRNERYRPLDRDGIDRTRAETPDRPHVRLVVQDDGAEAKFKLEAAFDEFLSLILLTSDSGGFESPSGPSSRPGAVSGSSAAAALLDDIPPDGLMAFIRSSDRIAPNALEVLSEYAAAEPDIDVFYGDEDSISQTGEYNDPRLKPDWSPVRQAHAAYIGRATFFRVRMLQKLVAGCVASELSTRAVEFLSSQEHLSQVGKVSHVRRVLLTTQQDASKSGSVQKTFVTPPNAQTAESPILCP